MCSQLTSTKIIIFFKLHIFLFSSVIGRGMTILKPRPRSLLRDGSLHREFQYMQAVPLISVAKDSFA